MGGRCQAWGSDRPFCRTHGIVSRGCFCGIYILEIAIVAWLHGGQ